MMQSLVESVLVFGTELGAATLSWSDATCYL